MHEKLKKWVIENREILKKCKRFTAKIPPNYAFSMQKEAILELYPEATDAEIRYLFRSFNSLTLEIDREKERKKP